MLYYNTVTVAATRRAGAGSAGARQGVQELGRRAGGHKAWAERMRAGGSSAHGARSRRWGAQRARAAGAASPGVGAQGAQPGRACARRLGVLAGQLGQVGALCT